MKTNKIKVLIVEDEKTLSMIISDTLKEINFDVIQAYDGNQGLSSYKVYHPDIIIADIMMPNLDGFEMVNKMRKMDKETPVLFLTARSSIDDLVKGFKIGANDYLRKPFKMMELIVRVKALVSSKINRMQETPKDELFIIGNYIFNSTSQTISYNAEVTELSYMESEILKQLCLNINHIVEVDYLMTKLWNDRSIYNRNSLHVFIHKLRKRLSADKHLKIINIRSIGYKLIIEK